jgi:D-alanine-D-alanine ligase-like ATP-grasp enzyme
METQDYLVTFDRIGRNHGVAPLEVKAAGTANSIAHEVYGYARKYLASSEVEVIANLDEMRGKIIVGGFRPAGDFTIEAA